MDNKISYITILYTTFLHFIYFIDFWYKHVKWVHGVFNLLSAFLSFYQLWLESSSIS